MTTICDAALQWAARGFRVFPLQALSKLPAGKGWTETATTDPATIFEVLADGGNYGVLCHGLIVVDVDEGKHPGALARFKALGYPATLAVSTPSGGFHFYYTGPSLSPRPHVLGQGIDIRSGNGFVVGPGSQLAHGAYALLDDRPVAAAPEGLVAACRKQREKTGERVVDWSAPPSSPARIADAKAYLTDPRTLVAVEGAGGDFTTFQVAAALCDRGVTPAEALELMLENWNDRCLPPWEPDDLRRKVDNAYRYGENEPGVRAADKIFEGVTLPPEATPADDFEVICAANFSDEEDLPPREWLVPDLIPAGYVTLLYGDGGVGKSTIAAQLAHAVATNGTWLGMKVGKTGPAVFFSAEEEKDDLRRKLAAAKGPFGRFSAMRDIHLIPRAGLDSVLVKFDRDGNVSSTELWKKLVKFLGRVRPGLVVLDNLADIFQGNEVDKTQARQTINVLQSICTTLGTTVVVLAHPSRTGMATGDGSSGNTAWSNSARSRLYLERHKTERGTFLLSLKKANYSEPGTELRLTKETTGAFKKTESSADAEIREAREIADILVKVMTDASSKSMTPGEAAKAVSGHPTAIMLLQQDGDHSGVKKWLTQRLAGGVRMGDELLHFTADGRVTLS